MFVLFASAIVHIHVRSLSVILHSCPCLTLCNILHLTGNRKAAISSNYRAQKHLVSDSQILFSIFSPMIKIAEKYYRWIDRTLGIRKKTRFRMSGETNMKMCNGNYLIFIPWRLLSYPISNVILRVEGEVSFLILRVNILACHTTVESWLCKMAKRKLALEEYYCL